MKFCTLCRRSAPAGATICSFDGHPLTGDVPIEPGTGVMVAGYRILDVVANGSTGTVFRAEDSSSGSRVALKLLSRELCATASVMHRVRRETKNAIKLANPNVARVLDCGDHDGRFFIVREWLEGHPLSVALKEEGPLPIDRASAIAHQICSALGLIHRVGLVHRDLKPNHVFIGHGPDAQDPMVKLIDIGVAARVDESQASRDIFGTAEYLSPEQAEGKLVSFRSDLYSLGCVLHEMLAGVPVFSGTPQELRSLHQSAAPQDLLSIRGDVPAPLAQLVTKLLSKQASARPFSAAMVQRELERVVPACKSPLAPVAAGRGGVVVSSRPQPRRAPSNEELAMAQTLVGGVPVGMPPDAAATVRGLGPGAKPQAPFAATPAASPAPAFIPSPGADGSGKRTIMGLPVVTAQQIEASRKAAKSGSTVSGTPGQGLPPAGWADDGYADGVQASPAEPWAGPQSSPGPSVVVDPALDAMPSPALSPAPFQSSPSAPVPPPGELTAEIARSSGKSTLVIVVVVIVALVVFGVLGLALCAGCEPSAEPEESLAPSAWLLDDPAASDEAGPNVRPS
jgi:serine/threonine-protein kinase